MFRVCLVQLQDAFEVIIHAATAITNLPEASVTNLPNSKGFGIHSSTSTSSSSSSSVSGSSSSSSSSSAVAVAGAVVIVIVVVVVVRSQTVSLLHQSR